MVISALALVFASQGAVCIAIGSGNWETSATWSCGHVPTCGDSIIIPATITVTITAQENYGCGTPMQVVIYGTLAFITGNKLQMPCGSALYLEPGGTIDPGTGGGKSNLISICGTDYWIAGEGPITGPQCFNCVLPIKLITLNAVCNGSSVTINWATATETNNHYFTVQRSDDGYNWNDLGTVNSAGTSTVAQYYKWTDENPLPGTSYYQLKQTDFDGQTTYVGVIASSCTHTGIINLYPNPSKGDVYYNIESSSAQPVSVKIINEVGQTVVSYQDNLDKGSSRHQLPTRHFTPGVYTLIIEFSDGSVPLHKPFIMGN